MGGDEREDERADSRYLGHGAFMPTVIRLVVRQSERDLPSLVAANTIMSGAGPKIFHHGEGATSISVPSRRMSRPCSHSLIIGEKTRNWADGFGNSIF
jgi:hypothetical protein